jgi:hypothetical protein
MCICGAAYGQVRELEGPVRATMLAVLDCRRLAAVCHGIMVMVDGKGRKGWRALTCCGD